MLTTAPANFLASDIWQENLASPSSAQGVIIAPQKYDTTNSSTGWGNCGAPIPSHVIWAGPPKVMVGRKSVSNGHYPVCLVDTVHDMRKLWCFSDQSCILGGPTSKNIAKGTTDPRNEFISQVPHKSWSNFNFRILIMDWLKNLNETSVSRLNLNLKLDQTSEYWPRFNSVTSTKHQQQNTKLQLQSLAWTSTSKSSKSWLKCSKSASKSATNCCQHYPHY